MNTKTIQISYPDFSSSLLGLQKELAKSSKKVRRHFLLFALNLKDSFSSLTSPSASRTRFKLPQFKNFSPKKSLPVLIVLVSAGLTVWWFGSLLTKKPQTNSDSAQKVSVLGARAKVDLGREFSFPVKDAGGKKDLTQLKFVVESAELRDEIIVNSKRATAVEGRTFLIVNLKITSEYTKGLNINTRDYFRLTVNGKEADLLAPEIHSDPVLVQPISTKLTRFGFPINTTDKNLVLVVGEISGTKTKIDLNLQ